MRLYNVAGKTRLQNACNNSSLKYIHCSLFLLQSRTTGSRLNIVIVAEGAIDMNGEPISSTYVKDVR